MAIRESRLVLTADNFDAAVAFFRDAAELELVAEVAGTVRIVIQSDECEQLARELVKAGAEIVGGPVVTPWGDCNVRLVGPDSVQLTLFTPPDS